MTDLIISNEQKQIKVWNLYRVSTKKQGGEGEEDIPIQETICKNFAEQKGWTVTNELVEKLSGFNTPLEQRTKLTEIKQGALNGDFDILLIYHSDRLGRGMEYTFFLQSLYQLGLQVWSVKEGELKSGEHQDALVNFIKFWQAEGESRKTSMRVKDSFKEFNEHGYYMGGSVCFGYDLYDTEEKRNSKSTKTIKKIKINPNNAEIVKLIYSLALNKGWGGNRISNYLNEQDITNSGEKWKHKRIVQILRNPIYMGYKRYHITETIPKSNQRERMGKDEWKLQPFNSELAIILQDDWNKVQDLMNNRNNQDVKEERFKKGESQPTSSQVLFSGLLFCGICNTPMYTNVSYRDYKSKTTGEITKHIYYRYECPHKADIKHEQARWNSKKIDSKIENSVIKQLNSINLEIVHCEDSAEVEKIDSRKVQLKELKTQLKDKVLGYNNTEKLFNDVMEGKVELDISFVTKKMQEFHKAKEEITIEIIQIEDEIKKAEVTTNDITKLRQKFSTWVEDYKLKTDLDEKKMMLNEVVDKIYVYKKNGAGFIKTNLKLVIENALQNITPDSEEVFDENVVGQAPSSQSREYTNLLQRLHCIEYIDITGYRSMNKAISFSHTITI